VAISLALRSLASGTVPGETPLATVIGRSVVDYIRTELLDPLDPERRWQRGLLASLLLAEAPAEVAPPAGCCESEKATGDEVADEIRLSGMDCGCEAPSPAHPGEPAPAVCGTSFEVSIELHQRMHIAAWTPAAFAARDEVLVRGDELPPAAVLTEDQSVLHRRRARGTSLVLAVLSVARI